MQKLYQVVGAARWVLYTLSATATVLMAVHVTSDVLAKYFFGQPIVGTLEMVTYYYMVAAVFLPLAIVEAEKRQVVVELFTHKLPERVTAGMDAIVKILLIGYVGVLSYTGYLSAMRNTRALEISQNVSFDIYIWPSRWFVVIGCGGMLLYLILHFLEDAWFALTGKRIAPETQPNLTDEV